MNLLLNSRLEHRDIGNEGWEFLAKTVQLRPGFVDHVSCCHHVLQEAKKEDMRVIWEIVGDIELVHELGNENFKRRDGENYGWTASSAQFWSWYKSWLDFQPSGRNISSRPDGWRLKRNSFFVVTGPLWTL